MLVARQLGIYDTDRGLGGGGRSDEKYCSLNCLLLTISTNPDHRIVIYFIYFSSSDLFLVVYVTEQFWEL